MTNKEKPGKGDKSNSLTNPSRRNILQGLAAIVASPSIPAASASVISESEIKKFALSPKERSDIFMKLSSKRFDIYTGDKLQSLTSHESRKIIPNIMKLYSDMSLNTDDISVSKILIRGLKFIENLPKEMPVKYFSELAIENIENISQTDRVNINIDDRNYLISAYTKFSEMFNNMNLSEFKEKILLDAKKLLASRNVSSINMHTGKSVDHLYLVLKELSALSENVGDVESAKFYKEKSRDVLEIMKSKLGSNPELREDLTEEIDFKLESMEGRNAYIFYKDANFPIKNIITLLEMFYELKIDGENIVLTEPEILDSEFIPDDKNLKIEDKRLENKEKKKMYKLTINNFSELCRFQDKLAEEESEKIKK
jgi:hypothetical protein